MSYKWSHPTDWLKDKIRDTETLPEMRSLAQAIAEKLDGDEVQDIFEDEMSEDGYFNKEDS